MDIEWFWLRLAGARRLRSYHRHGTSFDVKLAATTLRMKWPDTMTDQPAKFERQDVIGPLAIALLALLAVVLTLDAAGDYPKLFEGPGITLDESFNVQMGVYQWNAIREYHVALLHPDSVREVFGPGSNYNPDHPPLGRVWLGFWHDLTKWLFPPADHPSPFVTDCARVGSATAFALTVFLIGLFATKWYGRAAGIVAAVSLVLMPRVFAHAHLASLETFMNLTYSATVLAVAHWWRVEERARRSWMIPTLTGLLFGLALLTKMQAILIPPVVGLWALWHWRVRAIKPLAIFGLVGLAVFFVGWPWLWLDPAKHFHEYFARTTSRAVLNCYYFGQVWADKEVPWHYPFVMFAVTVPVGLHALGLLGCCSRLARSAGAEMTTLHPSCGSAPTGQPQASPGQRPGSGFPKGSEALKGRNSQLNQSSDAPSGLSGLLPSRTQGEAPVGHLPWAGLWLPRWGGTANAHHQDSRFGFVCEPREQLLLAATLLPLVLFALPGVAVYDGERLFLISYPIWAVLIGRGAEVALSHLRKKVESGQWRLVASRRARGTVVTLFLLAQSVGVIVMHPCQLSYYNLLVGGLYGADRLGFERTYWGDCVTRSMLASMPEPPETEVVYVMPVLHQFQLDDLMQQSPILRKKRFQLRPFQDEHTDRLTDGWLVVSRKADVPSEMWGGLNGIGERRRGVTLAVWRNLGVR